ncbi:MAG: tetratricopeptide repeat protein [Promethearchaeota archaeon]
MENHITYIEPKELIRAKKLVNKGKFDDVLLLIRKVEQMRDISLHDLVSWHLLKCDILFQQYLLKELNSLAEKTYKESLRLRKSLLSIDALYYWGWALIWLRNPEKVEEIIIHGEKLLKTLIHELPRNYRQREGSLAYLKGWLYRLSFFSKHDLDLALKHFKHSLTLREQFGSKHEIAESFLSIGSIFLINNGELNHAFKYIERALTIAKESNKKFTIAWSFYYKAIYHSYKGELDRSIIINEYILSLFKELNSKGIIGHILNNLAEDYRKKGELDRALKYSEQSLAHYEEIGILKDTANAYDYLIQILIDKGDLERAQNSLRDLEQITIQLNDKQINLMYLFDKALVLKTSTRAINRGKAEEILKELLEEKNIIYESHLMVLLHLCDLLIVDLRMTGDLDVLNDINSCITQILDITEKSRSYWVLGEAYLLQAKLALFTLDLKKARRLLTKGQQITENYELNLLAQRISNEHDELLKKLDMWKNLKKTEISLTKRMELSQLNEQMGLMVRKRVVVVPELSDEDPVLLLIVSEGGRPIFSQSFIKDQIIEDHLFGGFLSAIDSFVNEMFSEGLDRVSFGEHTLLMNSVSPFFMCYVYKGQSYLAQRRISYFLDKIQNDEEIWKTFNNFNQFNKEIQLKDIPSLETLIKEIFIDKKILIKR